MYTHTTFTVIITVAMVSLCGFKYNVHIESKCTTKQVHIAGFFVKNIKLTCNIYHKFIVTLPFFTEVHTLIPYISIQMI